MREIKFRVWDGEQMVSPDYINRDGYACWKSNSIPESSKDIMQFIGLKDKNDKEIYEGDILKLKYPLRRRFDEDDNFVEINVSISFDSGCFWFEGDGYTDCCWHFYSEYEIIGNIYENPELQSK